MKVRPKPVDVDALQWTGDNYEKILEFCPTALIFQGSEGRMLKIPTLEGSFRLDEHDWLLRHADASYSRVRGHNFDELYEPVPEGE